MKYRSTFLVITIVVLFLGITSFADMQSISDQKVRLTVASEKEAYKLGEPVEFSFELKNEGAGTVSILDEFGVGTGNLKVEISKDGKNFIGFNNPAWGTIDTTRKTFLQPGTSVGASGTVLWCWLKQDIPQFRLKESGNYYVKASYSAPVVGGRSPIHVESESMKIMITEPQGEDLEVWNKIKDSGDFAYFIQEGDFLIPSYKTEERAKFQRDVEQILNDHPSSFYSQSLRQSLDKFRAKEVKRQENIDKLRKEKPH